MARSQVSAKRLMINKANSTIVIVVAVAAFLTAFSLVASRALLGKRSYQNRVIAAQEKARDQLQKNIKEVESLNTSYIAFVGQDPNIIGGSRTGTGDRDGDNAKIVLDALPSKYDFPALTSSIEKIMSGKIQTITGVDDEANQNTDDAQPSTSSGVSQTQKKDTPGSAAAVDMPFEMSVKGSYVSMQDVLNTLQQSIRPININTLTYTAGDSGNVQLTITAKSFYQPEKVLKITTEEVK
ncbi:MAG TPA: hypothetical protein VK694_02275 [Verrucomicrobiae bacterium]|nr:hypothetical protein [Verrucomicrobiae bacterium]